MRINYARHTGTDSPRHEALQRHVGGIITAARHGEYGDAASRMNLFVQGLSAAVGGGELSLVEFGALEPTLARVLSRQTDADWVGLADVLEFELRPQLS